MRWAPPEALGATVAAALTWVSSALAWVGALLLVVCMLGGLVISLCWERLFETSDIDEVV